MELHLLHLLGMYILSLTVSVQLPSCHHSTNPDQLITSGRRRFPFTGGVRLTKPEAIRRDDVPHFDVIIANLRNLVFTS